MSVRCPVLLRLKLWGNTVLRKISALVRNLPTIHLAAASICTVVVGTSLLLWPSEEVEATRSRVKLIAPLNANTEEIQSLAPALAADQPQPGSEDTAVEDGSGDGMADLAADATPASMIENWIEYEVRSGDNLTSLFERAGLSAREVYQVSQATSEQDPFSRMYPGQTLSFLIKDGQLDKLRYVQDQLNTLELVRTEQGFSNHLISRTPDLATRTLAGTIANSLFVDAERAGLSGRMIMQMAEILGWDIDFALDIRKGDSFKVLYEEKYLDGKKIGEGDILAVQFINRGDKFGAVRFTDSEGTSRYYTPEGRSMRKAFLRSPVDFRRISSHFTPERFHPVLGTKRPHHGVDYAASTGTPIKASGDGKIIWRGTKGGYGRTVIIQHGGNITTLYGHMSKYRSGLSNGSRVKQGDIIGYVGASGLATGPHLHYEFRVNGVHKNPVTIKLPLAEPVPASERAAFMKQSATLMAQLEDNQSEIVLAEQPDNNG